MYRLVILLQNGKMINKNLSSKDECDTFILLTMEKEDIKKVVIENKQTKERYVENF
jgi:hypothetical protein